MIQFTRIFSKNPKRGIIKCICITGTTALTIRHLVTDSFAKTQSLNEKLVSVHLFSRHGARTPLYLVNGIEEVRYKNNFTCLYSRNIVLTSHRTHIALLPHLNRNQAVG